MTKGRVPEPWCSKPSKAGQSLSIWKIGRRPPCAWAGGVDALAGCPRGLR